MKKLFSFLVCTVLLLSLTVSFAACGGGGTESSPAHTHAFTEEVESADYLVSDASCTGGAVYYKSCECGEKGTDTFTVGEAIPHAIGSDGKCEYCKNVIYTAEEYFTFTELEGGTYSIAAKDKEALSGMNVVLPSEYNGKKVTEVATKGFQSVNMKSVVIPDTVTKIGLLAFGSTGIKDLVIPDSVTELGNNAFSSNSQLKTLKIGKGLTAIPEYCFYYCERLLEVEIPDNITSIGKNAFYKCTNVYRLTVGAGLKTVGEKAFEECKAKIIKNNSDLQLTIAGNENAYMAKYAWIVIDKDGNKSYKDTGSYKYYETEDGFVYSVYNGWSYSLMGYVGDEESVTLPETIGGKTYDISGFRGAKNVTLPANITKINDQAFYLSFELEGVTFLGEVTEIGVRAFANCEAMKQIDLPETLTKIAESAFSGTGLTSVTIPEKVTAIDHAVFSACYDLKSIKLHDGITKISSWAFNCCESLESITLPKGITEIFDFTFSYCSSLKAIEIPAGVKKIGVSVFSYSGLESITISEGVTEIGVRAFECCNELTSVEIPGSVALINSSAFERCKKIEEVFISEGVKTIDSYAFNRCDALKTVVIPASIEVIEYQVFYGCPLIENVYYAGTPEAWASVDKSILTETRAPIVYYSKTKPADTENTYWYYGENGMPALWNVAE